MEEKFDQFMDVRDEVLKALEQARKEKIIGSSLGAQVDIYPSRETKELLDQFSDLETLFIVSKVNVHGENEPASPGSCSTGQFEGSCSARRRR